MNIEGLKRVVFGITFLLLLAVYSFTLAPTVTLEYSGSLVTAADHLGVANPPGYPVWTMLAWLFTRLFSFLSYYGHPNPAWAVNFMSAFFGSLSCGLVASLVFRVGHAQLAKLNSSRAHWMIGAISVAVALLFGFSPVMWSKSVIAETDTLHLFIMLLFLLAIDRWAVGEAHRPYGITLLWGLGFLSSPTFVLMLPVMLAAFVIRRPAWREIPGLFLALLLGLLPIVYIPLAAQHNSPVNWGYAKTWMGFKHLITRGQYERLTFSPVFQQPAVFAGQMLAYFKIMAGQYPKWLLPVALWPLIVWRVLCTSVRKTIILLLIAFFAYSVLMTIGINGHSDLQTLFWIRVLWLPSFAVLALFIGLGLAHLLHRMPVPAAWAVAILLPIFPLLNNAWNADWIRRFGGCEQNGHDFGWQFGAWQLRGAHAILEELKPGEPTLPNPKYPPEMTTNAIFFGGTDPGRFVNTYMVFSARVRPDVFLITQNALADNLYMDQMRELYGDRIWIPSQQDSNHAFQKYVEDIQAGRFPAGADVSFEKGRVSIQGVQGVMMINGILARMIFEANKDGHDFYVEESYVIPWMYPYLEPHGLIIKMNTEPIPGITPEMVKNDREFWDWYTRRLLGNWKFKRDVVARKTFSKLRDAIAGLYAFHHMYDEAEYAFRQAVDLYPLSPEANFRLADILMQQRHFKDARIHIEKFLQEDPENERVRNFLDQITDTEKADLRRTELEGMFSKGQGELNAALELMELYQRLHMEPQFQGLVSNILATTNLPPKVIMAVKTALQKDQR